MQKKSLISLATALLAAGSIGCMGGSKPPYPGAGMASASNRHSSQAALQSGSSAASSAFGQDKPPSRTPFGFVANVVTNNPASAAVGRAWSTVAKPTAKPALSGTMDALSLANQRSTPSPSLYTSMGKLAERNGNFAQARVHYQKALKLSPTDVDALLAFGRLEDRQGRLGEALKLYDQAIRVNPKRATAHNDLGLCLARKGDFPAAVASLSHAVDIQPERKLYRNNLATVLVKLGRDEEALAQLAAVNSPAVAHYNMGVLLHKDDKVAGATEHFAVAAQLDPSMKSANAWLAKLRGGVSTPIVAQEAVLVKANAALPTKPTPPATRVGPAIVSNPIKPRPSTTSLVSTEGRYVRPVAPEPKTENLPVHSAQPNGRPYPSLPPAPPVPRYVPNYPKFPQRASPMRYPTPATSAQSGPGAASEQSSWPLHQPSHIPAGPLVHAGTEPPLPATVTNVYSTPWPQPLPPVQQARATSTTATH